MVAKKGFYQDPSERAMAAYQEASNEIYYLTEGKDEAS